MRLDYRVALMGLCGWMLWAGAVRVSADIIASESFAYAAGPFAGAGGGHGWAGNWVTGQPSAFVVRGLSLAAGVNATGGALFYDGSQAVSGTGARAFRKIDLSPGSAAATLGLVELAATSLSGPQAALGRPGTTVWLGALINGGTAGNGLPGVAYLAQLHLFNGAATDAASLALGDNNKNGEALAIGRGNRNVIWNFERTCAHDACPDGADRSSNYVSTVVMDGATHWLVMRFDFVSAATTQVTTWLDPAPGATAPPVATALPLNGQSVVSIAGLHFNWVEVGGQTAQFSVDELRFATTFGDLAARPAARRPGA